MKPEISLIVPAYNSSQNLQDLLASLLTSTFKDFEVIINDEKRSTDDTKKQVACFMEKGLRIDYLQENTSMAQARKKASEYAKGEHLFHLDSDMQVSKSLLSECRDLMNKGYDALVVPEESYGTTFWAKCKWLEKKCVIGNEHIESLRFLKKSVYEKLGGHDERMIFSEDKDLDLRVRKAGYRVGRTKNVLRHNEGELHLLTTCQKKMSYSSSANLFLQKHPKEAKWQANIFHRYSIYLKHSYYLFSHPLLFSGMIFMKNAEFACGLLGYIYAKVNAH